MPFNILNVDIPSLYAPDFSTVFNQTENIPVEEVIPSSPISGTNPPASDVPQSEAPHVMQKPLAEEKEVKIAPLSLQNIILIVWVSGSFITLCCFAVPYAKLTAKLLKTKRYHSNIGNIKVYVSAAINSPCVIGIVPAIYITEYAESCPDLDLILLHEKTHIRHGDHIWSVIRIIFTVILWWNPLIWAASLLSKRDAEVACDESVVKSMDTKSRLIYSRLIVDMIPKNGGFIVAFNNSPIKYRILRLTGKYKSTVLAAVFVIVSFGIAFLLAFVSNGAEGEDRALFHIHNFDEKATCTESAKCDCGETNGDPLGHKWKAATCTKDETCKSCNATKSKALGHDWLSATCTKAATCNRCSLKEGKALGHNWTDATCDTPKTCTNCNDTKGKPLSHNWTEATCTSPEACTLCQKIRKDALGHNYYLGICTRCNTKDNSFYESIKSSFSSPYIGYSKKSATKTLKSLGYSENETELILQNMNINWYEQALTAARFYTSERSTYTEENFRSNMTYLGFTDDQVNYAIKIAMEEDPPEQISYNITVDIVKMTNLYYENAREEFENNRKYSNDKEDDDSWKYGYDTPSVNKPIRWDYGSIFNP